MMNQEGSMMKVIKNAAKSKSRDGINAATKPMRAKNIKTYFGVLTAQQKQNQTSNNCIKPTQLFQVGKL